MRFDSYATPRAEGLLKKAKLRFVGGRAASRILLTETAAAVLFLAIALPLAVLVHSPRRVAPVEVAITIAAYLVAARVTFPVGPAWTRPTQVAFVPMLFIVPLQVVPLVVMVSLLLDLWPHAVARELSATRVLARIADAFYSLGPVLVLLAAHAHTFAWTRWPVLVAALAAQVLVDGSAGLARSWFAERIRPTQQIEVLWIYLTDVCLSCVGLLVAASAVRHAGVVLLVLPLFVLLGLFARERQQRLDGSLELSTAYRGTALLLGDVVEGDHEYTGRHSRDVVALSLGVADELGLDDAQRRRVEFGALLHDVGKIRVPKSIIDKPGKLDEAEWAIMKMHTVYGDEMLRQVGGMLADVGRIVRSSHERYDGRGYPDGLAAEAIPVEARIITACDSYSAMTADRTYRAAMSVPEALTELRRCAGTQFDPRVVGALERLLVARLQQEPRVEPAPAPAQ
jgi:putative nucleotidyltransferase with HDIG domain